MIFELLSGCKVLFFTDGFQQQFVKFVWFIWVGVLCKVMNVRQIGGELFWGVDFCLFVYSRSSTNSFIRLFTVYDQYVYSFIYGLRPVRLFD